MSELPGTPFEAGGPMEGHRVVHEDDLRAFAAAVWDEAVQAMAWCLDNGSAEAALPYVAEHNPHRAETKETP